MAQFYGEIEGNRGKASRQGTEESGLWAHVRGWNIGVHVECRYDKQNDRDIIYVYQTTGSNGRRMNTLLATLTDKDIPEPPPPAPKPDESSFRIPAVPRTVE